MRKWRCNAGGLGGGRKRKNEKMGLGGRQTIKDSISRNRLRVVGGGGGDGRGWWGEMDIGEGMGYDECCEMCKPDDSQTCTPGDKNTLYAVSYTHLTLPTIYSV